MIREGQDSCHLGDPPILNGNPATHNTLPSPKFHNRGENLFPACSSEEQASRTLPRFSAWLRILSTSLPAAWGLSCTAIYRGAWKARAKPSDQMTGTPTNWSDRSSPISPTHFGLRTLRLRSHRFVAAVFVPLNAISAANENGRATRSPPSSPKFCVVTPCATSRSFPNGSRRPF